MLNVLYAKCAECHTFNIFAGCNYVECRYAECHCAECHYAVCCFAEKVLQNKAQGSGFTRKH